MSILFSLFDHPIWPSSPEIGDFRMSGLMLEKFLHCQRTTAVLHHLLSFRASPCTSMNSSSSTPTGSTPLWIATAELRLHRNSTATNRLLRTTSSTATEFFGELSERVPYISISMITLRPLPVFLQQVSSPRVLRAAELSTSPFTRLVALTEHSRWFARQFRHSWF